MPYWWVNHKQTYSQETEGGYIWSPKTKANGARSHFYDNMTKTMPGDLVFSYANAKIQDVGVVTDDVITAAKPSEFGSLGNGWAQEGWFVAVEFFKTLTPLRPKDHIEEIAPLLPETYSPIQANGNGNQAAYLSSISAELAAELITLLDDPDLEYKLRQLASAYDHEAVEKAQEKAIKARTDISPTDKEQIILSRRGQGQFRRALEDIESCCRVTRLAEKKHLRASHIKPWREANDSERLDGNNGLLLAPHIDHLFDKGFISFDNEGSILFSPLLTEEAASALGVADISGVGGFNAQQLEYLLYHRAHIFQSS